MNRASILALFLGVSGVGLVLFGVVLAVYPHLVGAEGLVAVAHWQDDLLGVPHSPMMADTLSSPMKLLAASVLVLMLVGGMGAAFLLAGWAVWRFVVRPATRLAEADADEEPERERGLQRSIQSMLSRHSVATRRSSGDLETDIEWIASHLDPHRRHRLDLFLHYAGFDPLAEDSRMTAPSPSRPSPEGRRHLGRVLTILLIAASGFLLLWGVLTAFSVRLLPEVAGFPRVPNLPIVALLFSWSAALVPLLAAGGIRFVSRHHQRLRERWRAGIARAAEITLAGYDECLSHLIPDSAGMSRAQLDAVLRGLGEAARVGLDEARQQVLVEIDRAHGIESMAHGTLESR